MADTTNESALELELSSRDAHPCLAGGHVTSYYCTGTDDGGFADVNAGENDGRDPNVGFGAYDDWGYGTSGVIVGQDAGAKCDNGAGVDGDELRKGVVEPDFGTEEGGSLVGGGRRDLDPHKTGAGAAKSGERQRSLKAAHGLSPK